MLLVVAMALDLDLDDAMVSGKMTAAAKSSGGKPRGWLPWGLCLAWTAMVLGLLVITQGTHRWMEVGWRDHPNVTVSTLGAKLSLKLADDPGSRFGGGFSFATGSSMIPATPQALAHPSALAIEPDLVPLGSPPAASPPAQAPPSFWQGMFHEGWHRIEHERRVLFGVTFRELRVPLLLLPVPPWLWMARRWWQRRRRGRSAR